jgi:hypothetical protein
MEAGGAPSPGVGDRQQVLAWTTDTALGSAAWPTFMHDMGRSGRSGTARPNEALSNAVRRLYRAYFLRDDPGPGITYWVGVLRTGVPLAAVSNAFALSPEFLARYGNLDAGSFVKLVYANVLRRGFTLPDYEYWAFPLWRGQLSKGQVMLGFSESAEFRAITGLP